MSTTEEGARRQLAPKPPEVTPRTTSGDQLRRGVSIMLVVTGVALFFFGIRGFTNVTTDYFNWAGYIATPLGAFAITIFLLPLAACVHRLWISSDPDRRIVRDKRRARDEAVARLSASKLRPLNDGERDRNAAKVRAKDSELAAMSEDEALRIEEELEAASKSGVTVRNAGTPEEEIVYAGPPWLGTFVVFVLVTGAVLLIAHPPGLIAIVAIAIWSVTGVALASCS